MVGVWVYIGGWVRAGDWECVYTRLRDEMMRDMDSNFDTCRFMDMRDSSTPR